MAARHANDDQRGVTAIIADAAANRTIGIRRRGFGRGECLQPRIGKTSLAAHARVRRQCMLDGRGRQADHDLHRIVLLPDA